jgi:hypothetical protein
VDRTKQTLDELQTEYNALVRSKFTPPYLNSEQRRGIDSMIFEIWQELERRRGDGAAAVQKKTLILPED